MGKKKGISGEAWDGQLQQGQGRSAIPCVHGLQKPRGGRSQACSTRAKTDKYPMDYQVPLAPGKEFKSDGI